ncbi:NAD(P)-binding domain-containing protein [Streptomyces sp. TS71-3]|uniref:NAD(P)-binding domain-containing protein n=1 Tax=Streptomyces sp. TS71-3 TaxID=2733862 RepID=UPI001B0DFF57|nr:NAD(P)-binding domain-containing protein [Streptomyces sp. TS71-3]GHJ37126.1 hypothetical protein Sm713_27350 [Streptomyces sp. TS71-3]
MERIGIIGVGEIAGAIVDGLCDGVEEAPEIHLSPRGARAAAELSERYESVQVCAGNQAVVDRSELVILAVRPRDRHEALDGLRVDGGRIVVNLMAGVGNDELRQALATDAPLVRAIPLPSVRERRCITVTYGSHPAADSLFERLGGVLPVADEALFNVLSALTGTVATQYWFLATISSWATRHGIAAGDADCYVRGLYQEVGRSLGDETRSLHQLAAGHETPNGNNERVRTTWFDASNSEALTRTLDALLADLG